MSRTVIAVVILLTLLFSCEDSFVSDCSECYPAGVSKAKLKILIRNPDYVPVNPTVTLYEGAVEDGIVIRQFSLEEAYSYVEEDAILYKDYSATLEFTLDGRKYITTAGARPQTGYDKSTCEEPCYFIYGNVLDLRLRY
ncbi:MAG: hypothetical protein WAV93_07750 [Bacteroidales bacterium]